MTNFSPAQPLRLEILGLGHVPSFKNRKVLGKNWKTGKATTRTAPKEKAWMEAAILLLSSQLLSAYRIAASATGTELSLQSWIASCMPEDDSLKWIPEISVKTEYVEKGKEGCSIVIEKLE